MFRCSGVLAFWRFGVLAFWRFVTISSKFDETVPNPREVPQTALVSERRWTRMLSTVCAVSFAGSLVGSSQLVAGCPFDGDTPFWSEVLTHDPR